MMEPYKAHVIADLTRPIIGIDNRSGLEAFDIMADRIKGAALSGRLPALSPQREDTGEGEITRIVAGLRGWCEMTPDIDLSPALCRQAAEHIIGQPAPTEGVAAAERIAALESALRPFAEACRHLHPSQPDDGTTLDGFEVRDFRRAAAALSDGGDHAR